MLMRASIAIVIVALWLTLFVDAYNNFNFSSVKLESANITAYLKCKELQSNSLFTHKGVVKYYLTYSPFLKILGGAATNVKKGRIYFSPSEINNGYLDVTIAHELGHIQTGTRSQFDADLFAIKVLGNDQRQKFILALKHWHRPENQIQSVLATFDRERAGN